MRPSGAPSVLFCSVLVTSSELGTRSVERSKVWISVARTRMWRTSPSTPPTLTQSPTFTGRSTNRIRPETKFCTTCCRPKPMPTDRALAIRAMRSSPSPAEASAHSTAAMVPP